jgi:hypothetical protein
MPAGAPMNDELRSLVWTSVHPYVSVTVLECTADNLDVAFERLRNQLLVPGRSRSGRRITVVASTFEGGFGEDIDQLAGFVTEQRDRPAWATEEAGFEDTVHNLTVALRRRRLVAVHSDEGTNRRLQRWLDKAPKPPFSRIPARVLEGALHRGDAKSLWLRGVHQPRTTKPDIKNTGGLRLQDTINPLEDGTYAVGAARSELPDAPERLVLKGIVGSTPSASSAWFKPSADFPTFVAAVVELLTLIEKELVGGTGDEAFPQFAREVFDLTGVTGAYAIRTTPAALLPPTVPDELVEAAELLEDAVLDITAWPGTAGFTLDVGLNGTTSGRLKGKPVLRDPNFDLDIGYDGTPDDPEPVRQLLGALQYANELARVYYSSGHTVVDGRIWEERPRDFPFPNWHFEDFTGYDIDHEKPPFRDPQGIHDNIAKNGDRSLFTWVVDHHRDGWLICDDGPGETADFLHISPDGKVLKLIHVKGANSSSRARRVALGPFEVVVAQALKNLVYTDRDLLLNRLPTSPLDRPACWDLGDRTSSRSEFLESLELLDSATRIEIVIVQPHLSEAINTRLRLKKPPIPASDDLLRLRLLDELLNSARSTVTRAANELILIGSLT